MEAVLKREIIDIGYEISRVEDGRVYFWGDDEAIVRANLWLRTTERVLINVGSFKATTYDELFEKTKAVDWSEYLTKDAKFWVSKASSVKSKLFSPSDIQSIVKKAIVEKMKSIYNISWFQEDGPEYPLRVSLYKDVVTLGLDTTGVSLHKRGYRTKVAKAPITETLAAALIMLTPWKKDRILIDPFCGSGTFAIEAAMMAMNMAPGLNREFLSQNWGNMIDKKLWYELIDEAREEIDSDIKPDIQAYDIDDAVLKAARENAANAGVSVHIQKRDVSELTHAKKYGFIITNPPYGERLEDKESILPIYKTLGERFKALDNWSLYMITSFEECEKYIGKKANKNRKVYNGMIKTYFYQFEGDKPPKARVTDK
jgi:hypothetical protein